MNGSIRIYSRSLSRLGSMSYIILILNDGIASPTDVDSLTDARAGLEAIKHSPSPNETEIKFLEEWISVRESTNLPRQFDSSKLPEADPAEIINDLNTIDSSIQESKSQQIEDEINSNEEKLDNIQGQSQEAETLEEKIAALRKKLKT